MSVKTRGFGSMSRERRLELAKKGGEAARDKGVAHRWDSSGAKKAGRLGLKERRANKHQRERGD